MARRSWESMKRDTPEISMTSPIAQIKTHYAKSYDNIKLNARGHEILQASNLRRDINNFFSILS